MFTLPYGQHIFTWLDIERAIRRATKGFKELPPSVLGIQCYSTGADFEVSENSDSIRKNLKIYLQGVFKGDRVQIDDRFKRLTIDFDPPNAEKYLIDIIESDHSKPPKLYPRRPIWSDWLDSPTLFAEESSYPTLKGLDSQRKQFVFYSFKGGVGRTTALATFMTAAISSRSQRRILVVDADLEAPGLTILFRDKLNCPISMIQLMEMIHYPASTREHSLDTIANELEKHNLRRNQTTLFFIPSTQNFENPRDAIESRVNPACLVNDSDDPWKLGSAISEIAERLSVDLVLVDLRAGLSELSSPLLFDPRFDRVLVTTLAHQSLEGTRIVLKGLKHITEHAQSSKKFNDETESDRKFPILIFSQIYADDLGKEAYSTAIETFNRTFFNLDEDSIIPDFHDADSSLPVLDALWNPDTAKINDFDSAINILGANQTEFYRAVEDWTQPVSDKNIKNSKRPTEKRLAQDATALAKFCDNLVFAEAGSPNDDKHPTFLRTDVLRNLATNFTSERPITISIGAKGSGKTYNFLTLSRFQLWSRFVLETRDSASTNAVPIEADILPFLCPIHTHKGTRDFLIKRQNEILGQTVVSNLEDNLKRLLNSNPSSDSWQKFWEREIFTSFKGTKTESITELDQFLQSVSRSVIFLFDGIEDHLSDPNNSEHDRNAVKALLELPRRLQDLGVKNIGIIVFVRKDYVSAAIKQNLGQFRKLYQPFENNWSESSFLRLVAWIVSQAKLKTISYNNIEELPDTEILQPLNKLWGERVGGESAHEAKSTRWVYSALCDLNGIYQPRDLVRFLQFSAEESNRDPNRKRWLDRILTPNSLRNALPKCSEEKINDAINEITPLKDLKRKLDKITDPDLRVVPFDPMNLGIELDETNRLIELGVFYRAQNHPDPSNIFVPEIYRSGLGLALKKRGRAKIVALMQRHLKRLPF